MFSCWDKLRFRGEGSFSVNEKLNVIVRLDPNAFKVLCVAFLPHIQHLYIDFFCPQVSNITGLLCCFIQLRDVWRKSLFSVLFDQSHRNSFKLDLHCTLS